MTNTLPIIDKINAICGALVAFFSYIFGEHWILFVALILLNIGDFASRWIAGRITGTESSKRCWVGILKKCGYWLMIMVSFGMSVIFIEIGKVIGINLQITSLLGWFVLSAFIINEIRSILENLVEAGFSVPAILVKGLEVANKAIDGSLHIDVENSKLEVDLPVESVEDKEKVVLQVKKK